MAEEKNKQTEEKKEIANIVETKVDDSAKVEKVEEKKEEKPVKKEEVVKKTFAIVDVQNARISKKQSMDICRQIRGKKIDQSIAFLEDVAKKKKALPMKGQYPYRRGGTMGRYPFNASMEFIRLLKSLKANAVHNSVEIEKARITVAIANKGNKVLRRGGREKAKRTHIYLKVEEREDKVKKENKKEVRNNSKISDF